MSQEQKDLLKKQLWSIANDLRGKMDADDYRNYILGFIFYKYLSERIINYANDLLKQDGKDFETLDENNPQDQEFVQALKVEILDELGYFLTPSQLFSNLAKKGEKDEFILQDLKNVLEAIENSTLGTPSEEDFDHLFSELDLTSQKLGKTEKEKNELVSKILSKLQKIDFQLQNSKIDILGDAYEYLIGEFAAGAGKKAGEFYTPQEVSGILARIVTSGKGYIKNIYDPTCGSGSLLLRVTKHAKTFGKIFGQELNNTTYNLARMNMLLHGVHYNDFDIKQQDTLTHPQHIDQQFEAIVANPPFSATWSGKDIFLNDERFSQYGRLAPASKADYAFILHMIYQLAENGTLAVVMPHGVLFRGAAEGHIRSQLIEKNYLDAVIGLPSNIFYGTSIPTCILVFKKCREDNQHILFIDASKEFEKGKNQNKLTEKNIDHILNIFETRNIEQKYSNLVNIEQIRENDYNLNIPRYVDSYEPEAEIDLEKTAQDIKNLKSEGKQIEEKIKAFCDELKIENPF